MSQIEVTAAIRRSAEDIATYLSDARSLPAYLPEDRFRAVVPEPSGEGPAPRCRLELHLLKRWWPLLLERSAPPNAQTVQFHAAAPLALTLSFGLSPMKADRRGPRTAVRLSVAYSLPGGLVGKLLDGLLIEREMLKTWDLVMRRLPIVLEGPPKSGLKSDDP